MAKKRYYDITNLLKTESQYNMLLGQRANGKSYQVKEHCIKDAIKGNMFVYLRRYERDIKTQSVIDYFADMPINKYHKDYEGVFAHNGYIYLCHRNEEGIIDKKLKIGRYCALNLYERYKSTVFADTTNIIYEEFITDAYYLTDEPRLLMQFISTVFRLNEGRVFLIGNTLSRVCPYFKEWCLEGVLKQKQGTIELYHYNTTDNNTIQMAVEYCANTGNENKMFFGQASKQIVSGEWDVTEMAKLPKAKEEYEKVYELKLIYQHFQFIIELLVEPIDGGVIIFVYPCTKNRDVYRIIQEEFSDKPNITSRLDSSKRPEVMINNCIKLGKVAYSDNLTAADFNKCLANMNI